jgi:pyridoxamine 5'-phosphate oxidase
VEREEILSRLNRPQGVCLATVDQDEPRVRGIQLYAVDERGVLFQTGPMKAMHKELMAHPMAELCFIDSKDGVQIRVRGEFIASTDEALKREIVDHPSRVYLNPWRARIGDEAFFAQITVFQMRKATAQVWTMETNLNPTPAVELF